MSKSKQADDAVFICERCNGTDDVTVVYINDEPKTYCSACQKEFFTKKNPVGRPSLGITKKVSLTLEEHEWYLLDQKAVDNRAKYLRDLVKKDLSQ